MNVVLSASTVTGSPGGDDLRVEEVVGANVETGDRNVRAGRDPADLISERELGAVGNELRDRKLALLWREVHEEADEHVAGRFTIIRHRTGHRADAVRNRDVLVRE